MQAFSKNDGTGEFLENCLRWVRTFVGISWKSPVMSIDRLPNYTDIMNWEAVYLFPI